MPEASAQPGKWVDPYPGYNFKLEIKGVTQGHFTECSGLGIEIENIKYREGGLNQVVHNIPGRVEYSDVTLRYGLTASRDLWDWVNQVAAGQVARKHVSIVMLGSDGTTPVVRWDLIDCWPSAWRGSELNAMGDEVAIESITLVFDSLNRS